MFSCKIGSYTPELFKDLLRPLQGRARNYCPKSWPRKLTFAIIVEKSPSHLFAGNCSERWSECWLRPVPEPFGTPVLSCAIRKSPIPLTSPISITACGCQNRFHLHYQTAMMANGRLALNLDLKTRKKWNPEGLFRVVAGTRGHLLRVIQRVGSSQAG